MQFPRFLSRIPLRIHCEGEGAGGAASGRAEEGFGRGTRGRSKGRGGARAGRAEEGFGRGRAADIAAAADAAVAAVGGLGAAGGVSAPQRTVPPPPPVAVPEAVLKREKLAERKRKGRRSTILTAGRGLDDALGLVNRPQARGAELLGG